MSAVGCPFWCVRHQTERRETFRDACESTPTVVSTGPTSVTLTLVRPAGRSLAVVEVAVGAQVAQVPIGDVQALIDALRMCVGTAQRSGVAS